MKKQKKKGMMAIPAGEVISVNPLALATIVLPIEGIMPLIQNRFDPDDLLKTPKMGKGAKKELSDDEKFQKALYGKMNGNYLHPAKAIKDVLVTAASLPGISSRPEFKFMSERLIKGGAIRVCQRWLFLDTSKPHIDKDWGNNHQKITKSKPYPVKVRVIRAAFDTWKTKVAIEYDPNLFTGEQIANLLNIGGWHVGIGANRAELGGENGRFRVAE